MKPDPATDLPLVWTMGKVGTTSLATSIKAAGLSPVCCHYLHPSKIDYFIDDAGGRFDALDENIQESLALHRFLPMVPKTRRLKVLTSMRDPLARNISAFYENIYHFGGPQAAFEERLKTFLSSYPHTVPMEWWDMELRDVLGFDILRHGFDREAGFTTYETPVADILVLRADLPLEQQSAAVGDFLGLTDFVVSPDNMMSDELDRAESYLEFRARLLLPRDYVNFIYDSAISRLFWTQDQIAKMRAKWRTDETPWVNSRWFLSEVKARFPRRAIVGRLIGIGAEEPQQPRESAAAPAALQRGGNQRPPARKANL